MPVSRRARQRSVRITVACALLAAGAAVVAVSLLVDSTGLGSGAVLLSAAAVLAWLFGAAASRIISNELAAARREHGGDRAEQAKAYNEMAAQRADEQERFVASMRQQSADHEATIARLKATLRLTEKRAELAEQNSSRNQEALARAQQEIVGLRARIAELEAAREELTESEDAFFDLESLRA